MNSEQKAAIKEIKAIKSRLSEPGMTIYDLRVDKLEKYLAYRLEHLVVSRGALLPKEQRYLLAETGPGNLRFDPEILDLLLDNEVISSDRFHNSKTLREIIKIKREIEALVDKSLESKSLHLQIEAYLKSFIVNLRLTSMHPLAYEGVIDDRKIVIFFYNGGWLTPNTELFERLKYAHRTNRYPVFIAKKIHGVLFPFFKEIGVFGFNTYSTLLTKKAYAEFTTACKQLLPYAPDYMNVRVTYNGRFSPAGSLFEDEQDPLSVFLGEKLSMHVGLSDFLSSFVVSKHSFGGYIDIIKSPKLRKNLAGWESRRAKAITRINRGKST